MLLIFFIFRTSLRYPASSRPSVRRKLANFPKRSSTATAPAPTSSILMANYLPVITITHTNITPIQ